MKPNRTRLKTRIAVRHARAIRIGVRDLFSTEQIVEAWFSLYPEGASEYNTVTTQMARDWVRTHAHRRNADKLFAALARVYADGWVFSDDITTYEIARAVKINKSVSRKRLARSLKTNWNTWSAGRRAASTLLRPPTGLQALLDSRSITIDEIANTTISRIGTLLADALERNKTPKQVAILIDKLIDDPVRAITIAQTEMSYAIVQASKEMYRENGVEQVEYLAADPCDDCQENLDASPIYLDEEWPMGDPPVHPNCMCDIAPYEVDAEMAIGE